MSEFDYSQAPSELDARGEADSLSAYPEGSSLMPISDTADWDEQGLNGLVITYKGSDDSGGQTVIWETETPDETQIANREWDGGWGTWWWPRRNDRPVYWVDSSGQNAFNEAAAIISFAIGFSCFDATAGADFGPNSGQAGAVKVFSDGTNGVQWFTQYSNNTEYRRTYSSGSWSSWVNVAT